MSNAVLGVVAANVAYAAIGVGLAAALGAFDRRSTTFSSGLVGLPLGIAVVLILSAYAALLGLPLGPTTLSLLAVGSVAAGAWQLRQGRADMPRPPSPGSAASRAISVLPALGIALLLVAAARTTAVKPLVEWDGWVLWATKARVLYEHPGDGAAILQQSFYGAPSYPPGLPALEATTMRAAGRFDGTVLDLQLVVLVAAAIIGMWSLLRPVANPLTIALALLGTLASSQVAYQLTTNYADVPLAFLTATGVVAGAVWLVAEERRRFYQLACACTFLTAAAWVKNEGLVFGAAAMVSLLLVAILAGRGRRDALVAGAGFTALVAPWRLYAAANDLRTYDYDLASFADLAFLRDRADRVGPAARELVEEMAVASSWGAALVVIVLAVVVALVTTRRLAGIYAGAWLALSFWGLVATYWISNHRLDNNLENSSYRTVVTVLVTGLCLVPLLLEGAVGRADASGSQALLRTYRAGRARGRLLRARE
jgi:hypothetical protein